MPDEPALADLAFARGSWPWTALREHALLKVECAKKEPDTTAVIREFVRVHDQDEIGPLCCLFMAESYWNSGVGSQFARQGLQRLDEQLLRNDLAHFTEGDLWGAKAVEKLAELATHLSDEQRGLALSYAPPIARAPLEAVLERRAERPEELAREAVTEAVLQAWRGGWREQVQQELQAIAGPAAGED
jgi:hypothetical protein